MKKATTPMVPMRRLFMLLALAALTGLGACGGDSAGPGDNFGIDHNPGNPGNSPPGWQQAELIETDDAGDAQSPQIVHGTDGTAIAVWEQSSGMHRNIWTNRFHPVTGWGTAELIETDDTGNALFPRIVLGADGQAIVVWEQYDGSRWNIWSRRYDPATGWGAAGLVDTDTTEDARKPWIALGDDGQVIAVWEQYSGSRWNIWFRRYDPGTGWGLAKRIDTGDIGDAWAARIAFGTDGRAIAVWNQNDGDGTPASIWSNRYDPVTGWSTAGLIETSNEDTREPQIATSTNGAAIAVWHQYDGTRTDIWSNRYDPDTGWSTAELIETNDAGRALFPQVIVGIDGRAIAVWHQYDGGGTPASIWSNRYDPATDWGTAELIETDDTGDAILPQITLGVDGQAIVVWNQFDGMRSTIWLNRHAPSSGWGAAELIEANDTSSVNGLYVPYPQIAIDDYGNIMAVWGRADGTIVNLYAKRWIAP